MNFEIINFENSKLKKWYILQFIVVKQSLHIIRLN